MIVWSEPAQRDLERVYSFLLSTDSDLAARTTEALYAAVGRLEGLPRLGTRLPEFGKREVRRLILGKYEVRYELKHGEIVVLGVWHVREDR